MRRGSAAPHRGAPRPFLTVAPRAARYFQPGPGSPRRPQAGWWATAQGAPSISDRVSPSEDTNLVRSVLRQARAASMPRSGAVGGRTAHVPSGRRARVAPPLATAPFPRTRAAIPCGAAEPSFSRPEMESGWDGAAESVVLRLIHKPFGTGKPTAALESRIKQDCFSSKRAVGTVPTVSAVSTL